MLHFIYLFFYLKQMEFLFCSLWKLLLQSAFLIAQLYHINWEKYQHNLGDLYSQRASCWGPEDCDRKACLPSQPWQTLSPQTRTGSAMLQRALWVPSFGRRDWSSSGPTASSTIWCSSHSTLAPGLATDLVASLEMPPPSPPMPEVTLANNHETFLEAVSES